MAAPETDLSKIQIEKELPSIVIPPAKTEEVKNLLRKHDLVPRFLAFKQVLDDPNGKRLLLCETATELPDDVKAIVGDVPLTPFKVTLDYRNLSLQELLKTQLPEGCVIPSSFETVGTLAHLNLLDEQLPYKHVIGQAILLKNKQIKTVVAKVGSIHNVYRSMDLEVLAGEPKFETEVRLTGLRFQLDFSKVYWNTRLEHEHEALTQLFTEGSIVADAMCGIGPFAVRAALRKNCRVLANDLNPDSYKWLLKNIELNGVKDKVECFNMDARDFIRKVFSEGGADYIVMNLPATAVEFLDAVGEAAVAHRETARMPMVYFYSFDSKTDEHEESLNKRARAAIGMDLPRLTIKRIRDVSPGKDMFRCGFSCSDLFVDGDPSTRTAPQ